MTLRIELSTAEPGPCSLWPGDLPEDGPARTLMVTWTVDPEPADAGVPEPLQTLLATWLAGQGQVAFPVRLGLLGHVEWTVATTPGAAAALFDIADFPWWTGTQAALIAGEAPDPGLLTRAMTKRLMGDAWVTATDMGGCHAVVRAGIDGDAVCMAFTDRAARATAAAELADLAARAGIPCAG
ncbi:hypothetical protein [Novosphingobium sp.]|uniref:hypothetical protein n=1 Tax=Novosphingobium sp. TaxID=1874826 RepID=UPI003BAC987F